MKLTKTQRRHLRLLAETPEIFAWKSTRNGRLVDAYGSPDNWTRFQIIKIDRDQSGRQTGRRISTITEKEHFEMAKAGYTAACQITDAGRRALAADSGEE